MHTTRIMYVITTGESGGAQSHLFDLCTHLPEKFKSTVVTGFKGPMGDKLEQSGIPVQVIPSLRREISPGTDFKAYQEIYRLINSWHPDLVCLHSSKAGFLGRLAAWRNGIPAIFTAHGWAFAEGVPPVSRWLYRHLERWAAYRCARIICVSQYDYQLARRHQVAPAQQMAVVHNGIPLLPGLGTRDEVEERAVRIIMVARFAPQKDQLLLLQAASRLEDQQPFELIMVGDGPRLESIRAEAAGLPISNKVQFLGDRDDVEQLLRAADIFVLSSRWEGFPITILEAMRAGLPVIASDVGGCREAVADGATGFMFAAGDMEGLTQRLDRLISEPDLRRQMGICGYERFRKDFTVERMVEDTVQIYDEVLGYAKK